ncbi:hypothetical protein LC605_33095, partial [Nostoc sp. CHAB 5836]|uniref:hypothetical protein n=1 Tax=Nostoc sp. CHAB 5836 TaxID=2780404 RepID=UPI001E5309B9
MIIKRETLVEMFSTFLKVVDRNNYQAMTWQTDRRLKYNMEEMISQETVRNEEAWARYWLKEALQNHLHSLANKHITFYLEETCYWVGHKIKRQIASHDFTWMDYWQIARAITATELTKLLGNYDFNNTPLKNYAQLRIHSVVLDRIRIGRDLNRYTDWALLRNITKKAFKEALQKVNVNEQQETAYLLAWNCFREIYTPSKTTQSHRLPPPTEQQFTMIAERYNQLRSLQSLPENISAADIERLLKNCIFAIRENSKLPVISSFDAPNITIDNIQHQVTEYEVEEDERFSSLRQVLVKVFDELPVEEQNMLILEHGLKLTQTDMGKIFNFTQSKV